MKQTLAQVAASLCVDLIGEDRVFTQVSINTRTMKEGDLFIAIKGENFDGHQYIEQAEKNGACGLIVEQCCGSTLPQIIVENTRIALGDIAALWSSAFSLPIVAITGSCGKTTVKEMTAAIFQSAYADTSSKKERVLATKGNFNNEIGVPLTLLRLQKEHQAAVIELGANHVGEIKYLVDMVQPDVAVITNVTHAHIEGFGSIEGIAKGKAEIYTGLERDGTAVINADDDFFEYWKTFCNKQPNENGKIKQLTFGLNEQADVSAEYINLQDGFELKLKTPAGNKTVHLKQFGLHNIYNALAATAVTLSSGCTLKDVKSGLENFTNASGRLEKKKGVNNSTLFDDTYNANPGSVRAGINAIKQVESEIKGEAVLILGDMGELGEESRQLHFQLGVDAAKLGIKQLFTVGTISQETTNGYNSVSLLTDENKLGAVHFSKKSELIQKVKDKLHKDSVVLIKGSRSMVMEEVVNDLLDNSINDHANKCVQTEGNQ
ncbi:MAG: UDP-N-acetylmuramoyl-tripeptide--D-alanyl-D-alanine ligase [Gammaproteobacteria bacterium]|nr:UDP-N-acetylmuramoyl-tripeptide--D-alanyl-D-alanine ligase [Gammaproteobacteria bacterium]